MVVLAALGAAVLLPAVPALAREPALAQEPASGALIIGLPLEEARALAQRRPAALGLGVYPPSRDAAAFLTVMARGDALEDGGLRAPIETAGRRIAAGVAARAGDDPVVALARAVVGGEPGSVASALDADVSVVVVRLADDAEALLRLDPRPAVVVATDGRTPVLIALLGVPADGLLANGVARRTGIVTPADVARTVLDAAGIPVGPPGELLTVEPDADPASFLEQLAARMEADTGFLRPLTKGTVLAGIVGIVLGTLMLLLGRRRLARAFALATAMVPAGYLGALFVQGATWEQRSLVIVGAFGLGAAASIAGARRTAGWLLLATTIALAAVTVIAEAAPDGAVARALWGNPLDSWRFFGLRNHLAAFLAGGYLAGAVLLALPSLVVIGGGVVIGFVVAAPTLGANFVAVLTLGFGTTMIVLARAAGRPRFLHLPFAAVAGGIAIGAALAVDAGTPVSHGGRAVESIRSGGIDEFFDIIARRARLNVDEITSVGVWGVIAFVLAAFILGLLFWWALRAEPADTTLRAGVGGLAASALVALVIEDSGFWMGSILGIYPWIVFTLERARAEVLAPVPPVRPPAREDPAETDRAAQGPPPAGSPEDPSPAATPDA